MAKQQQSKTSPVTPNFKDVDKTAQARAKAAIAGGKQSPLKPPKDAKVATDKNGKQYTRWTEPVQIIEAYRTVTDKGLMDVAVTTKIRQSANNAGERLFGHFYLNNADDVSEGHAIMNDRSNGAIITLLVATGYMPAGSTLKGSLLDKMFPSKGQPGASSPLKSKTAIANVVQTLEPAVDRKTKKPMTDDEGNPIMQKRDSIESFLPEGEPDQPQADEDSEDA